MAVSVDSISFSSVAPQKAKKLAPDLRELREDETLRDGAPGDLTHVQERPGRVRERLIRLPGGELLDAEEPAAVGLAEDVELVATVTSPLTGEREGNRVGMPDQFEHGQPS